MHTESIELHGVYRYPSRDMLEQALAAARAHVAEEDVATVDVEWMNSFKRVGDSLGVTATLPVEADRFLAAEVLALLACHAIEGAVEARRAGRFLDLFPACCVLSWAAL